MAQSSSDNCTTQSPTSLTQHLIEASLAVSTRQAYRRVIQNFEQFHLLTFSKPMSLPISEKVVAQYICHLYLQNLSSSTITSYISAISFIHKIDNFHDPTNAFFIKKMLKGVQNERGGSDTRLPITLDILNRLIDNIEHVIPSYSKAILCKAMFLLAFHAFLRIGEFTITQTNTPDIVLQIQDVVFGPINRCLQYMVVTITNYKHSDLKPVQIEIPISATPKYCPVRILREYLQLYKHTKGPLFQFMDKSPVTRAFFTSNLQNVLKFQGLDPKVYKSHSFRIGAASSMASRGTPQLVIQKMGRWKSDAVKRYIRMSTFDS